MMDIPSLIKLEGMGGTEPGKSDLVAHCNHFESLKITNASSARFQNMKHKSQLYLYPLAKNNMIMTLKTAIPFIIISKGMKCLGINLTKEVQSLYSVNYSMLKEIQDD